MKLFGFIMGEIGRRLAKFGEIVILDGQFLNPSHVLCVFQVDLCVCVLFVLPRPMHVVFHDYICVVYVAG